MANGAARSGRSSRELVAAGWIRKHTNNNNYTTITTKTVAVTKGNERKSRFSSRSCSFL